LRKNEKYFAFIEKKRGDPTPGPSPKREGR